MRRKRRGIALILVLFSTFLLTMLVGAFFQINFDNFSLTAASQRRLEAQMAAESGLTYARYKLEMDQSWGPPFSGPPVVLGPLRVKVKSNTELLGEFADGRSFSLQVVNQLNQAAPVLPALPTGVPKDAVKVTVRGYSQAFTSGVELLMVGEPLYDAAATSNGVLNMIGNKTWEIHSRDKIRNWIRSNDAIYANDVLSGGNITKFKSDVGSAVPGIMWSKKDIYNQNTLLDASNLNNFNSAVNGVAAARSTMNNNIYNLKVDDLKVPTTSIAMRPGRYVVSESSVIPINEETRGRWPFTRTVNVDQPAQPVRAIAFYPDGGGAPQVTIPRSEMLRVAGSASPPYQPPPAVIAPSDTIILDPAVGANFVYEFGTGDFKISGDQQYTVAGNFTIGYDETPPTGLGPKLPKPDTDIIISTVTNPTFLNVTNNFVIDGKVKGRGAVAAGKEVVMRADADLSASVTDPLVFYGGGNVTIDATGRQNVKFTGLVYANNDFKIKDTASPSTLDEVRLHGALVARNGRIDITAANAVTMTYDPAFVENLTKGLPDNHRRLKPMSWRQL